jgi:uncharacterized protein involved in outer membrane biogenesis
MGRTFLMILGIAVGAIVLLLAAVAVVVATLDVNTLVAPLAEQVKRATGRELTVRGRSDLSISLEPRLRLRDVTLANKPGAAVRDMVTAREVEVQVALLPLLKRRLEVTRFTLLEPHIALETDAAGRGNWEFGRAAPKKDAADGSAPAALAFGVGEFAIERGTLDYRDGKTGETTKVEIDRLFVRAREPSAPVVAEFSGKVQGIPIAIEGSAGPLDALVQRRFPLTVKGQVAGTPVEARAQVSAPQDAPVEVRELALSFGASRVNGTLSIATGGARPSLRFTLASPVLRLADLALVAGPATRGRATTEAATSEHRLFPPTPIALDGLRGVDAQGTLAIDHLVLPRERALDRFKATVALANGRLELAPVAAAVFGGTVSGKVVIDATAGREPALDIALAGHGLDLSQMLTAFGVKNQVQGGRTEISASLQLHGRSPRAWAADARGTVLASVGPAQLPRMESGVAPALIQFLDAVNPFRASDATTDLRCAVARLPLANGVARIDRSIAAETSKLGVAAIGTIDLRSETLDLALRPQLRQKVDLDVTQLAGLVRVRGPIASPTVGVDAAGTAAAAARNGAAAGTGGWSEIARALVRGGGETPGGNECAVALGKVAPAAAPAEAPAQSARTPTPASPLDDIGRALQGLRRK